LDSPHTLEAIDRALAEFQRDRRPRALAAVFDAVAPELLLVAIHVTGDAAAAEDAVQDTFLAVIETIDRYDASRPAMPWLVGILANRARRRQRQRPLLAADLDAGAGRADDPHDRAAALELAETVGQAVRSLPATYRDVMTLHLLHGLQPVQIAHALGRRPGTVKAQLHRGLEHLRRALPAGVATALAAWLQAGRGLAAVRQALEAQLGGAPAGLVAARGLGRASGWLVPAALAVLAAGGVAYFTWSDARALPPSEHSEAAAGGTRAPAPAAPEAGGAIAADRVPVPGLQSAGVEVQVRWEDDGTPASDVAVSLTPSRGNHPPLHERWLRTDARGVAAVADWPVGALVVRGDRGGEVATEVRAGTLCRAMLAIPAGVRVQGRVVDPDGHGVAGARVFLSRARVLDEGHEVATSGTDGGFVLRAVEAGRCLSAFAPGFRAARMREVVATGRPGEATVELRLEERAVTVTGRVIDMDGAPIAGARVMFGMRFPIPVPHDPARVTHWRPPLWLESDADGRFRSESMPAVRMNYAWARAPGYAVRCGEIRVDPARGADIELGLQRGATLSGVVTDQEGQVVPQAHIALRDATHDRPELELNAPSWARSEAWADAEGRFRVAALLPVRLHVQACAPDGREDSTLLRPAEGEELVWNPRVRRLPELRGLLLDAAGAPLPAWRVELQAEPPWRTPAPVETDARGAFMVPSCEDCEYRLWARPAASAWTEAAASAHPVRADGTPLVVTVPPARMPSARLRGTLVGASGDAQGIDLVLDSDTWQGRCALDAATGAFDVGPLPPGRYHLQVVLARVTAGLLGPFDLAAGEVHECGPIRLPVPGALHVRVVDAAGRPVTGKQGIVSAPNGTNCQSLDLSDGQARAPLLPGAYFFHVLDEVPLAAWQQFTVAAEATTELTCTLPASWPRRFLVTHPDDGRDLRVAWTWRAGDGRLLCQKQGYWKRHANPAVEIVQRFPPGDYEVELVNHAGLSARGRFAVTAGEPDPPAVVLELR
jgi:RNA polymerase sigma-70 factor (ECF subfamily)